MVTPVLVDSNFYIGHLRVGRNPFLALASAHEGWEIFTCGMVMLEVLRGVRDPQQLAKMERSFSLMSFIPTTQPVWLAAQRLAWEMDRRGRPIQAQDHLIAACALKIGAVILTADGHFRDVPGVTVVDALD